MDNNNTLNIPNNLSAPQKPGDVLKYIKTQLKDRQEKKKRQTRPSSMGRNREIYTAITIWHFRS